MTNTTKRSGLTRILSMMLVLIMVVSLMPAVHVHAAGGSFTTNKDTYEYGEGILISTTGAGTKDWVGIYDKGATPGSAVAAKYWFYAPVADNTWVNLFSHTDNTSYASLKGLPTGEYDIIMMLNDGYEIQQRKTITITAVDADKAASTTPSISATKTSVPGNEEVKYTATSYKSAPWIGLYEGTHGADTDYGSLGTYKGMWQYVNGRNGSEDSFGILPEGEYTIVLFDDLANYTVDGYVNVTVTEPSQHYLSLENNKTTYKWGEDIKVASSYYASGSWIGLFETGTTADDHVSLYWIDTPETGFKSIFAGKGNSYYEQRPADYKAQKYDLVLYKDGGYIEIDRITIEVTKEVVDSKTVTVPATCEKEGSVTYTYTDGTTKTEVFEAKGHAYGTAWVFDKATETHSHVCANDETHKADTAACSFGEGEVTTPPTAEEDGVRTFTCSVCQGTKTAIEPATGKIFDYEKITTEPTCENPGVKTIYYKNAEPDTEPVPAKGHNYTTKWEQTAANAWTHSVVCLNDKNGVCECEKPEKTELCDYRDSEDTKFVDNGNIEECTATHEDLSKYKGAKYYTCNVCNGQYVASFFKTDKKEYEYGDDITVITNYTEGADGTWVGMYPADVTPAAGESIFWYNIPAELTITSDPYEKVITDITTSNLTEGTGKAYKINSTGSRDFKVVIVESGFTPSFGSYTFTVKNKLVSSEAIQPTCTEDGYMLDTYADGYTVKRYKDQMTDEEKAKFNENGFEALGHDWSDWAPVADYTKESTTKEHTRYCKRECGVAAETESCAATITSTETKKPEEETDGENKHSCSKCGGSYTTVIPALNKRGEYKTIAATCESDGGKWLISKDGSFEDMLIETYYKTGHQYDDPSVKWQYDQTDKKQHYKTCSNKNCETPKVTEACDFDVKVDEAAQTVQLDCKVCGGGYSENSLVVTNKNHYGFNEPVYVTAYTKNEGAWVGVYRRGDIYGAVADGGIESIYFYWVEGNYATPVDIRDYYTNNRGESFGSGGEFEIVLFGDELYGDVLGKTYITADENDQVYTLAVNGKEVKNGDVLEFVKGETIKVSADYEGIPTQAWVGLYTSEMPEGSTFKNSAAWYYIDDEKGTDHVFELLQTTCGTYSVVVLADGGYDLPRVNVTIKVRPEEKSREVLQEYPCLPGTIKITYKEPLYVDEEGNPGPDYEFVPAAATAQHKYDKVKYNNNSTHSTICSVCSTPKSGTTACTFTWTAENGKHTGTCSVCKGVKTGNCNYGAPADQNGTHVYTCGTCKLTKSEACTYGGWTFNLTAKNHSAVCTKCADVKTEACKFDEGKVTKLPTTTAEGEKTYTCSVCTGSYVEPIEKLQSIETTRIFGSNRYETAFKTADVLKKQLGVEKFDNVIIACGTNFADALAGSYLAAVKNAPILLVDKARIAKVTSYIKSNVKAGGTVYILGGENAVPKNMESGLGGFNVKRFAGSNRYDTNLMILKEAGVSNQDILIATGTNFADSLSASATGKPILLVGAKLTSAQKTFLKGTTGKKYILGGVNAVSESIEKELKAYGTVERLGGANRYATSTLIAETFFKNPTTAVLSYAMNFPDGLCGGVVAYKQNAPMLLVIDGNGAKAATTYAKKVGIKSGYALGGTGLISDATMRQIFSMGSGDKIEVIG